MKALPAIDLRDGACVQLVGGAFDRERVRLPDPLAQAQHFARQGFTELHVVDLDAAVGGGQNSEVIRALIATSGLAVQVGGGVRSTELIEALVGAGARRVVVGTRALEDPTWFEEVASRYPGRLVAAVDVRGRAVLTRGWRAVHPEALPDVLGRLSRLPLAGLLVTAVHVEGQLSGVDRALFEELTRLTGTPIVASGGVTSRDDLLALRAVGCAAAVIGMALYTGVLDGRATAEEFSSWP